MSADATRSAPDRRGKLPEGEHEEAHRRFHTPADYRDAASDPDTDGQTLAQLAECPYPFVWQALASNPRTPACVLLKLCSQRDSPWNDSRLLRLLAEHPNADREVLLKVLVELEARLLTSTSRPYAAVLALAVRQELEPDELQRLAALPGASSRMRTGLRRRLSERASPTNEKAALVRVPRPQISSARPKTGGLW
ncbi:hypothetical protein [Actinomadura verrucosospora]|uniref:hypothetical protein n=1 Tax=Actinomadura verrucosospora TaxID=46165 RepID=UPI001C20850C|nr:hypothetical protein [Actinomadura verrucosospora]